MVPLLLRVNLLLSILSALLAQEFELNKFECGISIYPQLIVNGSTAKPGQFPWMVRLKMWFSGPAVFCGGSITTKRHVLTAAHCVVKTGTKARRVQARYGSINRKQGKMVEVKRVLPHPQYTIRPMAYDIAILEVEKPFQYSNYARPVCLPQGIMNLVNMNVVASGWGLHRRGRSAMDYLQYTALKVLPNNMCKIYRKSFNPYTMICAFKRGTGTCIGDSGGPLATKEKNGRFVQVGTFSYIGSYDCVSKPQVFTRVDALLPWIQKEIKNQSLNRELSSDDIVMDRDPVMTPYSFWSDDSVYEPEYEYY